MVKRLALPFADGFPVPRTRREHQDRARGRVIRKAPEHRALIVEMEVKEAVPGKDRIEAAAERQLAHVADQPLRFREAAPAHVQQGRRGIDARHLVALPDEVRGDRLAASTAEVQDRPACRDQRQEAVDEGPLVELAAAHLVPLGGILLVEADDPLMRAGLRMRR
jgi:hypothetical protein